ncbi:MAG: hypothetical protein HQK91_02430 [Nitrospirae bacterium]|nr:hypothetical protein [Nitrospirota bacterium]
MNKTVVVCFEGESVKVVFASRNAEDLYIDNYMTLTMEQFDDFLSNDESDNYIIVTGVRNIHYDMVTIPKTKDKYIKPLVKREVSRRHAEFKDFIPIVSLIGNKVIDGKHRSEYFVISIDSSEINVLIDHFLENQKSVVLVYPVLCVLMSILPQSDTPFLCMFEVGQMKNVILVKDGNIIFTRSFTSQDEDASDVVAKNIDLTVNYCKESLKVAPSFIIMAGEISKSVKVSSSGIPSIPLVFSGRFNVDQSVFNEYVLAIAAINYSMERPFILNRKKTKSLPDINIATTEYKTYYYAKSLLKYITALFLVLSIISLAFIGESTLNILKTNKEIDVHRMQLSDISKIYNTYNIKRDKVMSKLKNIEFLNRVNKQTRFADFLSELSSIKLEGISIESLVIQNVKNITNMEMTGTITAPDYYGFIKEEEVFKNSLNKIAGVKGIDYKSDIEKKTYKVNFTYSSMPLRNH